jgi:hypothetical protein
MSAAANTPAITRGRNNEDVPDHLVCPVWLDAPPNQCRDGHILGKRQFIFLISFIEKK